MLDKLKSHSIQTIILIALYVLWAPLLSLHTHQAFYTISVLIKDILIWMMPITVGVFIASTIDSFERKAPLFVLTLVVFAACSNGLSIFYAYGAGMLVASAPLPELTGVTMQDSFAVLWRIPWSKPTWWGADKGSMVGVVLGCVSAIKGPLLLKRMLHNARQCMESLLTRGFARLIPLFMLGFIAQIHVTGLLRHIVFYYGVLVLYLLIAIMIYIFFIFLLGNSFHMTSALRHVKNLMPAGVIALTSGCSLSTMPWTIQGSAKNLKHPDLAKAIIPATTNIQQTGDCLTNSFLCFLVYQNFFGMPPDMFTWISFMVAFIIVRFTTVAMIGGDGERRSCQSLRESLGIRPHKATKTCRRLRHFHTLDIAELI